MKRVLFSGFFIFVFCLNTTMVLAQGAVPFVQINPSPAGNGLAGAYNALPTRDAFGAWFNPAQLGNFGMEKKIAWNFYPQKVAWLPGFDAEDLGLESSALAFGHHFKINRDMQFSFGISRISFLFDLGNGNYFDDNGNPLGTYHSKEYYTQYAVGIGMHTFFDLNAGYGFKLITSDLAEVTFDYAEVYSEKSKARVEDFGLQLTLPVISERMIQYEPFGDWKPYLAIHGSASLLNYGDLMKYLGERQILPRQAVFGLAFSAALHREYWGQTYKVIQFDWSTEARDLLYKSQTTYRSYPGRINFYKHLIETRSDVDTFRGYAFEFGETVRFSTGRYKGDGWEDQPETFGFQFSTRGLFRYLGSRNKNTALSLLYRHLELEYQYSEFDAAKNHGLDGTTFTGLLIAWKL